MASPDVVWGSEHIKVSATEAMQAEAGGAHAGHAKREAIEFLKERLTSGSAKMKDMTEEAEANGISAATLRRAKKELQVKAWKERKVDGDWFWELPAAPSRRCSTMRVSRLSTLSRFEVASR
jgi:hypothetical protein